MERIARTAQRTDLAYAPRGDTGFGGGASSGPAPVTTPLTQNEELVLAALRDAGGPAKAYALLAGLKAQGVRAPMTVYRALDRLEGRGLIHKLEGLGAFVICNHEAGEDRPHALQAFLVCDGCAGVSEVAEVRDVPLDRTRIDGLARAAGFAAVSARLEIRGRCKDCG